MKLYSKLYTDDEIINEVSHRIKELINDLIDIDDYNQYRLLDELIKI